MANRSPYRPITDEEMEELISCFVRTAQREDEAKTNSSVTKPKGTDDNKEGK